MVRQLRRIPACLNKDRALTSTAQLSVPCGALTPETLPAVRICCRFAAVRALEMESLGRCFVDTFGHHLAMLHELMGEACPNKCEGTNVLLLADRAARVVSNSRGIEVRSNETKMSKAVTPVATHPKMPETTQLLN